MEGALAIATADRDARAGRDLGLHVDRLEFERERESFRRRATILLTELRSRSIVQRHSGQWQLFLDHFQEGCNATMDESARADPCRRRRHAGV
jgi:hypothetical protein